MQNVRAPLQGTKRADGRWQIIVTTTDVHGAKIRKTIIKRTLEDCQTAAYKLIATTARRAEDAHTMEQLIDVYKDLVWPTFKGPGTARQHQPAYNRILKWFAEIDVREIDAPEVARWIRAMESDPKLSGRSVQAYRNVLSVLLGYAEELGWRDGNPAKGRKLRVSAKPKHRERVTEDNFRNVVDKEKDPTLKDLWQFLGETGMRPEEALELKREDIFRSMDLWWIRGGMKTDAGRNREIPLSDDLANRLVEKQGLLFPFVDTSKVKKPEPGQPLQFPPPRPYKYRHLVDLWKSAMETAEETYTNLYQLRKLAISRWIHAGLPDGVVKTWAGHTSITITKDVYERLGRDRLMMAATGTLYVSSMSGTDPQAEKNPLL